MKSTTKRKTVTERAQEIGCSVQCLTNWKKCGVDIFDDEQVKTRIAKSRILPPELKPEWRPVAAVALEISDDSDPTQIDIETIIRQISVATDKNSAQTVKTQIDALVNAYKLREAAGKYVSKALVKESMIRIGATFKAALLRMEADLPPALEGMSPASMQQTIRHKIDEVLRDLSEEYEKAYGQPD